MTVDSILTIIKDIIDICLVWTGIYFILKSVKNNVKFTLIFKGIIIIAMHGFAGDKNNTQLQIINGDKITPSGGIFINEAIYKEFKEIAGKENCKW